MLAEQVVDVEQHSTFGRFREILTIVALMMVVPLYLFVTLISLAFVSGLTAAIILVIFLAACGYWIHDRLMNMLTSVRHYRRNEVH